MKVILNQDVYNLGEEGDVCEVARGYARNYLLPRKLAVVYNNANRAQLESRRAIIEKKKEEKRKAALSLKEKIEGLDLTIPMSAGESGKLFGSVSSATVADALMKEGIELERKQIEVPSHTIKMVGTYTARVKLYEGEAAELKIHVESDRKKSEKKGKESKEDQPADTEEPKPSQPAEQPVAETESADEPTAEAEAADVPAAEETVQQEEVQEKPKQDE